MQPLDRRPDGSELIPAPHGAQKTASPSEPENPGRFPAGNPASTAQAQITTRYVLTCRASSTVWTQRHLRPIHHDCDKYKGEEPYHVVAKTIRYKPDARKREECGEACWYALGDTCGCECKGANHGSAHERPFPRPILLPTPAMTDEERAEFDALYRNLEQPWGSR